VVEDGSLGNATCVGRGDRRCSCCPHASWRNRSRRNASMLGMS
jgi:hypothetical protein